MKGSEGRASLVLSFGTGWMSVVNFTLWPQNHQGRALDTY